MTTVAAVKAFDASIGAKLEAAGAKYVAFKLIEMGVSGAGWDAKAMDGEVKKDYDGCYTVKVIKSAWDEDSEMHLKSQWIPDPRTAHTEALTNNIFIPTWTEAVDDNGFSWADNSVVTSGAGKYILIVADYGKASSENVFGYGYGLVKVGEVTLGEDVLPTTVVEAPTWTGYSVIGSFGGHNWDFDADLAEADGKFSITLELAEGDAIKIRKDHDWQTSFGFAALLDNAGFGENEGNILIQTSGEYTFVFDPSTNKISATLPDGEELTRIDAFVTDLTNPSGLRDYREGVDHMINDFSADGNVTSVLRVLVDETANPAPTSGDAAIYKIGTNVFDLGSFAGLGFRMRLVEGELDLSQLVLGLRGADAYQLFEINLGEALDTDGESLPALTNEFQDFIICPQLSIEDDTTVYLLLDGTPSETRVLGTALGMHLYLKGSASAIIEIDQVFGYQTEKIIIDDFDRFDAGQADSSVCWWRGSTGFCIPKSSNANLNIPLNDLEGKDNLVLQVLDDASGVTINGKAWNELKDNEGNALAMPVNGKFNSFIINLEQSGLTGDLELVNDGKLIIASAFSSNLETKAPVTEYPLIDTEYINMFDDFNRDQATFYDNYDAAIEHAVDGFNYVIGYNNGSRLSINEGVLVFDGTGDEYNYIQLAEGRDVYEGEPYLVLVLKATDGANFNDFRFNVGNGVVYYNDMVSAYGLHLPAANATNYPYTFEDGFMLVVIDLAESGMDPTKAADPSIDFYFSGEGKLLLDSVFYAHEAGYKPEEEIEYAVIDSKEVEIESLAGYTWGGQINVAGADHLEITLTTTEEILFKSLRLQGSNGAVWMKDGGWFDLEGNAIPAEMTVNGTVTFEVDLEASGLAGNTIDIHVGDFGETGSIKINIDVFAAVADEEETEYVLVDSKQAEIDSLVGYTWAGQVNVAGADHLVITLTSTDEIEFKSLRLQGANGVVWMKDGGWKDLEGNSIPTQMTVNGTVTFDVDLEASGLAGNTIDIHVGDFGETGAIKITIEVFAAPVEATPSV